MGVGRYLILGPFSQDYGISHMPFSEAPAGSELMPFFNELFKLPQLSRFSLNLDNNEFTNKHVTRICNSWKKNARGLCLWQLSRILKPFLVMSIIRLEAKSICKAESTQFAVQSGTTPHVFTICLPDMLRSPRPSPSVFHTASNQRREWGGNETRVVPCTYNTQYAIGGYSGIRPSAHSGISLLHSTNAAVSATT